VGGGIPSPCRESWEMKEFGTLEELNVKPGDVVQHIFSGLHYTVSTKKYSLIHPDGTSHHYAGWNYGRFSIVSRPTDTPKLWKDMTPEEKGALLLAMHEKRAVEVFDDDKWVKKSFMVFVDDLAYRVKPNPKVKTVEMDGSDIRFAAFFKGHRITFDTINGKPDCSSIKMYSQE